jgi:hypothetical protein
MHTNENEPKKLQYHNFELSHDIPAREMVELKQLAG